MSKPKYPIGDIVEPTPEQEPFVAITEPQPDENAGKGGSYVRDPVTGARLLVSRTTGCCGK